ncbi:excinuclease ABC subunit B [Candidatus Uhrbacteria bacterium CG10_big_fil_rev_8_21_14_0_10_50_16]|uniref:UvrABC system protein B n=1 Tax=Candidatus Uhrbacteria bacterium CG10_big_fil_rev_8_21_14_0_10_50_16 TaxID=1975039 RepID=A0A2H0RLM6_9BACT|nr:MAG: excinuclease ABC subunit B [Candidatus Uhrbacteria bacterium CG10_big_fil_rev_8_21_14_0_10_50_16]
MKFQLHSDYQPAGDQPKAINALVEGLGAQMHEQTLLGVTGSGKTFTMANVIERTQRPTLVVAHNKTLAAQLCAEFRQFFPDNVVEYFVSYYDYYQPEAYMPGSDTYIEKEAQINDEIDRLRHAATQALLTRRDVIIVASVSCIYSLGSPEEYQANVLQIPLHGNMTRELIMRELLSMQFERTTGDLTRGHFRVRGDVMEIMPINLEVLYRLEFEEGQLKKMSELDAVTRRHLKHSEELWLFPARHYNTSPSVVKKAVAGIRAEMTDRVAELEAVGKMLEAERLKRRTIYDLSMIEQTGFCSGIENYSRWFDGRKPGEPPFTLIDFFPEDFLTIIDESHVTLPQVRGMLAGDQARKQNLVEHGFRLPSAVDNRPLSYEEFAKRIGQRVYVSATPGEIELDQSDQVVEQIIRPTGLIDPEILVMPVSGTEESPGQVDDLIPRIKDRITQGDRVLVTTLTKKMSEDLTDYLTDEGIKVSYLHSDIKTMERVEILSKFRNGIVDVIVGVNLLREGLDLPEVSLVAILDADKEGFLRSEMALIQTMGRAARNVRGQVVLYADKMTGSLSRAIEETNRRRAIQTTYNKKHKITPRSTKRDLSDIRGLFGGMPEDVDISDVLDIELLAEPHEIKAVIKEKQYAMSQAAQDLDFETAALLRDEIATLEKEVKEMGKKKSERRNR